MSIKVTESYVKRLECMIYYKNLDKGIQESMEKIRQSYIDLGELICNTCPESRSKSLALTYLEDSLMRSIQSLALQGEADIELR